jgi:hypothetical protein
MIWELLDVDLDRDDPCLCGRRFGWGGSEHRFPGLSKRGEMPEGGCGDRSLGTDRPRRCQGRSERFAAAGQLSGRGAVRGTLKAPRPQDAPPSSCRGLGSSLLVLCGWGLGSNAAITLQGVDGRGRPQRSHKFLPTRKGRPSRRDRRLIQRAAGTPRPDREDSRNIPSDGLQQRAAPEGGCGGSIAVRAWSPAAIDLCPGNCGPAKGAREFGQSFGRTGSESWRCSINAAMAVGNERCRRTWGRRISRMRTHGTLRPESTHCTPDAMISERFAHA